MFTQLYILIFFFFNQKETVCSCDKLDLIHDALRVYLEEDKPQDTLYIIYEDVLKITSRYAVKCIEGSSEIPCISKSRQAIEVSFFETKDYKRIVELATIAVRKKDVDSLLIHSYGTRYYYHYEKSKNKCKLSKITYSGY